MLFKKEKWSNFYVRASMSKKLEFIYNMDKRGVFLLYKTYAIRITKKPKSYTRNPESKYAI